MEMTSGAMMEPILLSWSQMTPVNGLLVYRTYLFKTVAQPGVQVQVGKLQIRLLFLPAHLEQPVKGPVHTADDHKTLPNGKVYQVRPQHTEHEVCPERLQSGQEVLHWFVLYGKELASSTDRRNCVVEFVAIKESTDTVQPENEKDFNEDGIEEKRAHLLQIEGRRKLVTNPFNPQTPDEGILPVMMKPQHLIAPNLNQIVLIIGQNQFQALEHSLNREHRIYVHRQHDREVSPDHHLHQEQGGDSHLSEDHWIAYQNLQVKVFTLYVTSNDAHLILRLLWQHSPSEIRHKAEVQKAQSADSCCSASEL